MFDNAITLVTTLASRVLTKVRNLTGNTNSVRRVVLDMPAGQTIENIITTTDVNIKAQKLHVIKVVDTYTWTKTGELGVTRSLPVTVQVNFPDDGTFTYEELDHVVDLAVERWKQTNFAKEVIQGKQ